MIKKFNKINKIINEKIFVNISQNKMIRKNEYLFTDKYLYIKLLQILFV